LSVYYTTSRAQCTLYTSFQQQSPRPPEISSHFGAIQIIYFTLLLIYSRRTFGRMAGGPGLVSMHFRH